MAAESQTPVGRGHRALAIGAGIAVSAVALWLALRGLRLSDVLGHIRTVRPLPLVACIVVATLTFPIRALRWRHLVRDTQGDPLPLAPAWHAVAIGFMGNNLLPLRAGELLRAWSLTRLAPVRMSSALASIAVERVFDALTVVGTLGLGLLVSGLAGDVTIGGIQVASLARRVGVVAALGFLGAAAVLAWPAAFRRVLEKTVPFSSLRYRLLALLDGVREGLAALRSPRRLGAVIGWSLVLWGVNAASFWLLLPGFGLAEDFGAALVVQGTVVFGVAVPSSPGYVGVFEAAIVLALALYGVAQDQALAYALTYHAVTFLPIILLGFFSLARTSIGWRDLRP
jgi:hypothetical protein